MIGERSVVPRVAKPFGSSLLESYWPEAEHLSNGLGSAVSFKIPMFGYVADLNELFTLARGWVIAMILIQKFLVRKPFCNLKRPFRKVLKPQLEHVLDDTGG